MQTARTGATFVYAAASLAFALIRPAVARMLAASLLITGFLLVVWSDQDDNILLGQVFETIPDHSGRIFAAVHSWPGRDEVALVIPASEASAVASLVAGDIVLAFRTENAPEANHSAAVFDAAYVTTLQASKFILAYQGFDIPGAVDRTEDLGIALFTILIVLFAVFLLRVGIGLLFAPVAMVTVWLLLSYNARSWVIAPIPDTMIEPLTLCAGAVGAVLAFKSTLQDPTGIVLRIAAAGLAVPLMVAVQVSGFLPAPLALGLPPLALVWPVLVPTLAATLLAREGLDLDLPMSGAVFLGLLLLRWPMLSRLVRGGSGAAAAIPVELSPDATGEISLDSLLRGRKET